jgi:hypothetical protein
MLGTSQRAMTLDVYAGLFDADLDAAAELMSTAVVWCPRQWCPRQCALGRIRTCDAGFRKPTLYPLSYEGGTCRPPVRALLARALR